MPFINGRYHVNPTMGAALEAAREAEAALLALQDHAHRDASDSTDDSAPDASVGSAPIHHVEIEATELVPPNSGRHAALPGRRLVAPGRSVGFVARIHRSLPQSPASGSSAPATKPETHVFANHSDLLDFLRDELSKA